MKARLTYQEVMAYIQEQEKEKEKEKEKQRLAKNQQKIAGISEKVQEIRNTKIRQSKYMRYREARAYYCLGMNTIQRLAKEAGATIRIGRIVMIDTEILNKYIDSFRDA